MTVRLVRDSTTTWSIRTDKSVLCTFNNNDAVEAKRFAEAWLTSFAERINLEVPDECDPGK
jgi:hypothetical protein